jgi:HAD superfamily hydrolase (TIGR01458 family)
MNQPIQGLLIDLDGTVYQARSLIEGAVETTRWLRRRGVPFLFTTNTSRKSRRAVVESLSALGLEVEPDEILTAPLAAARWLEAAGLYRLRLLLPEATHEDFVGFDLDAHSPEAVVVGDLGPAFGFELLNEAFIALRRGARLVAIHKNRFWLPAAGPTLDAGPFVVALEYAAGAEAVLVGKPAPAFFTLAARLLGVELDGLAVVGDDIESDIRGARGAGLTAIQVRTGKFDPSLIETIDPAYAPHLVIGSIAELPPVLEHGH